MVVCCNVLDRSGTKTGSGDVGHIEASYCMREVCLVHNGWSMVVVVKVEVSMMGGIDMGFYFLCDYFCDMGRSIGVLSWLLYANGIL